jgi:sugar lactone lactonase YvrE
MSVTTRALIGAVAGVLVSSMALAETTPTGASAPRPFLELPQGANTPDGLGIAPDGTTLILSVPNFNNDHLISHRAIRAPAPPFMASIDGENRFARWYEFKPEDMHPDTGRIGPMDNAFGPDGHLYVADMQVFFSKAHKSRILRIRIENGRPTGVDVVAEGMIAANGLHWMGDTLFVTDSLLVDPATQPQGAPLVSGVYALGLQEMSRGAPVRIAPYDPGSRDPHLVHAFESSGRMGFGADGVTGDDKGNLYVSVIEEAAVHRMTLDGNRRATASTVFAQGGGMRSADGIVFDAARRMFYTADFLGNAVHAIDTEGCVTTLHRNGDSDGADGSLDQPAEIILRGDQLVVVNMDMAWATPGLSVNTAVDDRHNLSVMDLAPAAVVD